MERCLRNALKAAAPVGSTSAWAEVTASGAGRLYAEQNFVRSAALGCIKVPSGASKSEIPVLLVDDVNVWPCTESLPIPRNWRVADDSTNGIKRCVVWQAT